MAFLRRAVRLFTVTVWLRGELEGRGFLILWSWEEKPGKVPGEREKSAEGRQQERGEGQVP